MIFVNLPVADIERSRKFFTDLGYTFNKTFSGDTAVTVVLGEGQFAMLIQRDAFDALHPVETADASKVKECVICLSVDSREDVDALVDRALAAGGTPGDSEDHGSMYGRSFDDPDGHSWQIFWTEVDDSESAEELDAAVS
ncbi:Possible glyoxalase/bleomycin resistance protein/ dioxygenase [Mycobacteroides abscessus subsp. massiliense]|uniref:VOC family protein n=1 Tax=Mycobacteroides abscessus TaxID=36809 RepID=UPI0009A6F6DD|nr:VOC family protein [Mycobacteroides abscessus]SLG53357.1 Possible glyoxalase/bleomycin resistance protein/ dioxygenase [Mycobacteroides abscessus subsp. massiliense]SLH95585.1 Possible glyoxalase/bleomycin resistance protein/ dioxygenase [Mycobacteroides abscessus subsp. massiliense]